MKTPLVKEIVLPGNVVFKVDASGKMFFDNEHILTLSPKIDLDKLSELMLHDKPLNDLINKYMIVSVISRALSDKEKAIVEKIDSAIFHSFIYDYKDLSTDKTCEGVVIHRYSSHVLYEGERFSLKTKKHKYDFSCLVKEIDDSLKLLSGNVKIDVEEGEKAIVVYYDSAPVYMTDKFALRDVLSYLKGLASTGNIWQLVNDLKELYKVFIEQGKAVELIFKIGDRVEELARSLLR